MVAVLLLLVCGSQLLLDSFLDLLSDQGGQLLSSFLLGFFRLAIPRLVLEAAVVVVVVAFCLVLKGAAVLGVVSPVLAMFRTVVLGLSTIGVSRLLWFLRLLLVGGIGHLTGVGTIFCRHVRGAPKRMTFIISSSDSFWHWTSCWHQDDLLLPQCSP